MIPCYHYTPSGSFHGDVVFSLLCNNTLVRFPYSCGLGSADQAKSHIGLISTREEPVRRVTFSVEECEGAIVGTLSAGMRCSLYIVAAQGPLDIAAQTLELDKVCNEEELHLVFMLKHDIVL